MKIEIINGQKILVAIEDSDYCDGVVKLPDDVEILGIGSFCGQLKLRSLNLPKTLTRIKGSAFRDCTSLETVNWDNVTIIEDYVFSDCSDLASVSLNGCRTLSLYAFYNCKNVQSISLNSKNLTSIGAHAFHGCLSLRKVILSSSVTSIDESAFDGCPSLESILINTEQTEDIERIKNLLPYYLRSIVSRNHVDENHKAAIEQFELSCLWMNLPPELTIDYINGFGHRSEIVQLRQDLDLVVNPTNSEELPVYEMIISEITQNHISIAQRKDCLFKLKDYLDILNKRPLLSLFSKNRPGIKTKLNVENTKELLEKLINSLQKGEIPGLSEEEKQLIKEREMLLMLIPESIQIDLGLIANYSSAGP